MVTRNEVLLCGLLLWTRISDEDVFCQIATSNNTASPTSSLVAFSLECLCHHLRTHNSLIAHLKGDNDPIQQPTESKKTSSGSMLVFQHLLVRLISQLIARCFLNMIPDSMVGGCTEMVVETSRQEMVDVWREHVRCLIDILRLRRSIPDHQPLELMDSEMLYAVRNFVTLSLSLQPSASMISDLNQHVIFPLWDSYKRAALCNITTCNDPGMPLETASPTNNEARLGDLENGENGELSMMNATLEALIQQTTVVKRGTSNKDDNNGSKPEEDDSLQVWHETLLDIFQQQLLLSGRDSDHMSDAMPPFWNKVLRWWLDGNAQQSDTDESSNDRHGGPLSPSMRAKWAWFLLYCVQECCCSTDGQNPVLPLDEPKLLLRLLVVTVVSQNDDIPTLRTLAWTVTCHLWRSLLETFGLDRDIYSLLRLAVVEMNLQIDSLLHIQTTSNSTTRDIDENENDNDAPKPEAFLSACGLIITQTTDFITQLDEEQKSAKPNSRYKLSKSSIEHVRHSLEQALNLCVLYFQEIEGNILLAQVLPNTALVGVFGSLLTEFDVFTHQHKEPDSENHFRQSQAPEKMTNALVHAVEQTMTLTSKHPQLSVLLVPGVTTILASAQGDDDREALIKTWKDIIPDLVADFWKSNLPVQEVRLTINESESPVSPSSVVWVSQLMELANDIFPLSTSSIENWKDNLIAFLQAFDDTQTYPESAKLALDAVVTCYVTLQQDAAPPDPHAFVLQRALSQLQVLRTDQDS